MAEIISSIIVGVLALVGVIVTNVSSNKTVVVEEQIKVINHRINDLEKSNNSRA